MGRNNKKLKDKKKKLKTSRIISNNLLMLKYIFKYTPGLIIYLILLKVVGAVSGVLSYIYVAKGVLDTVQNQKSVKDVLIIIAAATVINVLSFLLQSVYDGSYLPQKSEILFYKMHSELFEKAKNMELACYDNPKFYTDFVWAMGESNDKAIEVLENTGQFIYNLTSIASLMAIIVSVDYIGIIVAIFVLIVLFIRNISISRLEYELSEKQTPMQRQRDYTSRVLYQPQYAKEIRLNPVKDKLILNFKNTNKSLIDTIRYYSRKMLKWDFLSNVFSNTIMFDIFYLGYLLYKTIVEHAFTYGEFYALYSGTERMIECLDSLITDVAGIYKQSLYIERFRSFIEYEPRMCEADKPQKMSDKPQELSLKNVSFTYESLNEPTIKNISLTIHPGEKVALVGFNGAGKSTLIKLIMRLYDVTSGEIMLGDANIKEYSISDYRKCFGVVFQDYQLFAATIGENVKLDCVNDNDETVVRDALFKSGFEERLNTLPDGTKTNITREFDKNGVNLSGGEAQKVAIARIFPRDCNIVVLDEPSSALDPVSEYNVNQSMLRAAKDKTVIFISHRLSTTKNADRIIMLADGKIIEEGSHDELMKLNGKYADMFNMQAEKYRREKLG